MPSPSNIKSSDLNERSLCDLLLQCFLLRRKILMDKVRLHFCVTICMAEMHQLHETEKARLFYEWKALVYFRHQFITQFSVYKYNEDTLNRNPFDDSPVPPFEEFLIKNFSKLIEAFIPQVQMTLKRAPMLDRRVDWQSDLTLEYLHKEYLDEDGYPKNLESLQSEQPRAHQLFGIDYQEDVAVETEAELVAQEVSTRELQQLLRTPSIEREAAIRAKLGVLPLPESMKARRVGEVYNKLTALC